MSTYVLQRLASSIPVLLGVLFVTFALARLLPGDPCVAMLGERANEVTCSAFNERYGLNDPIPTQFWIYFKDVIHGDLGSSFRYGRPVTELITERLPVTMELSFTAMFLSVFFGVLLGIISAQRQNSFVDVATMFGATLGFSIPVFVLGLILAYFFAITLKGTAFSLPPSGRLSAGMAVPSLPDTLALKEGDTFYGLASFLGNFYIFDAIVHGDMLLLKDAIRHLLLPAIALSTIPMSIIARLTRSSLLEVIGEDYVRTARAKGLSERVVLFRHALRNALLPVVTIIGLSFGFLLSGAVLTETIFGFSGVGRILFDSITARDYAPIQGFTLITAVGFLFLNLLVDVLYGFLDPRIRLR